MEFGYKAKVIWTLLPNRHPAPLKCITLPHQTESPEMASAKYKEWKIHVHSKGLFCARRVEILQ